MESVYGKGGRQIAIDVLRGYFILSMASGHLDDGILHSLFHVWRWVDAASGFVCMSGFVLGLSQRARWERDPQGPAPRWILRRGVQIWCINALLILLGFSLRLFSNRLTFIDNIFQGGEFWDALWDIFTLQLDVPYFGLLGMYVVFLFLAYPVVHALRRNLDYAVVGISVTFYVLSEMYLATGQSTIEGQDVEFLLPAWQMMFCMGLWAGWRWRDLLQPLLQPHKNAIFAISVVGVTLFLISAHIFKLPGGPFDEDSFTTYFDKFDLYPLVVVYFLLILGLLVPLTIYMARFGFMQPVLRMVALFGRHSLACYVLLTMVHAVMWTATLPDTPFGGRDPKWFALAVVIFTIYCLGSEKLRQRKSVRLTEQRIAAQRMMEHRPRSAPTSAALPQETPAWTRSGT